MFPIEKYKFYVNDEENPTKVYAVSTYAGKTVRGVASCDPRDTFSLEKGKELAAARCNEKIAKKREKRARQKLDEAWELYQQAQHYYVRMKEYWYDAENEFVMASDYTKELLEKM